MGIEPFLISSSIVGVIAQRLVRVLCPRCKQADPGTAALLKDLELPAGTKLFHAAGCEHCKKRGYRGRVGIFELLPMTDAIKQHVTARSASHVIRDTARKAGMRTLRDDGLLKAAAGTTTIEEVLRVTQLE